MTLTLYYHPLSSYCWKALIALYETGVPFKPRLVNLGDEKDRAEFRALWPIGKFPVLRDEATDRTIPESSIIIEYLAQHYAGSTELVPKDPDLAWRTRLADRFYDNYVHTPLQKIVGDRLRPADRKDPFGVEEARAQLATSYAMIEADMAAKQWAMGDAFTLADCAAMPALHYANRVQPLAAHKNAAAYLARLESRPSAARVLKEAEPYFAMFPAG